jgi:hypothetical protein
MAKNITVPISFAIEFEAQKRQIDIDININTLSSFTNPKNN